MRPEDLISPLAAPVSNRDFDFFYEGLAARRLLVMRCDTCGFLRHPPGPMCPRCNALKAAPVALVGTGQIFSFTVHYYPPLPTYPTPHAVALVEMTEGVRVLGALVGIEPDAIEIGQAVSVEFHDNEAGPFFRFRAIERVLATPGYGL